MFNKKNFYKRTQDLKESYFDAAQFYWGTYEAWMNNDIIFGKKSKMYLLPRLSVQDIDTVEDWKVAETLFKIEKNSK